MILTPDQIEQSIAWLLQNGSPPVRYLTHKNLLHTPASSAIITNLWLEVQTYHDAVEIFSKQKADGSWCSGGSWAEKPSYLQKSKPGGYDTESPKYVTTIWVLPLLGEMGFTAADERIRKAGEYILNFKAKGMEESYRIFNDPRGVLLPSA